MVIENASRNMKARAASTLGTYEKTPLSLVSYKPKNNGIKVDTFSNL